MPANAATLINELQLASLVKSMTSLRRTRLADSGQSLQSPPDGSIRLTFNAGPTGEHQRGAGNSRTWFLISQARDDPARGDSGYRSRAQSRRRGRGDHQGPVEGQTRRRDRDPLPPAAWRVIEPESTLCRCGCGEWRYLRARHSARISSAVLQHLRSDAPMQQSLFPFCAGVRAAFERLLYGARDRTASRGISSKRFGPVLAGI